MGLQGDDLGWRLQRDGFEKPNPQPCRMANGPQLSTALERNFLRCVTEATIAYRGYTVITGFLWFM